MRISFHKASRPLVLVAPPSSQPLPFLSSVQGQPMGIRRSSGTLRLKCCVDTVHVARQVSLAPAGVRIRQWPARLTSPGLAARRPSRRLAGGLLRLGAGRVAGQGPVELAARADGELGEDLAQVVLDRTGADEQPSADLGVREAVAGQPRDQGLLGRSARPSYRRCACGRSRRWPAARAWLARRTPRLRCDRRTRGRCAAAGGRRCGGAGGAATRRRADVRGRAARGRRSGRAGRSTRGSSARQPRPR